MSASTQLLPPAGSSESAGTRLFGVPELVAIIISGWTQPELARLALLSRATAFECGRVLYKSPWVDEVGGNDDRLEGLASALQPRPPQFKDLGLGFDHEGHPSQTQLSRLFSVCAPLSELELAGQFSPETLRDRLAQSD